MALERDAAAPAPLAPATVAGPAAATPVAPRGLSRSAGAPMGDDEILALQQTAGNRAVGRAIDRGLIQRDGAAPAGAEDPGAQGTTD